MLQKAITFGALVKPALWKVLRRPSPQVFLAKPMASKAWASTYPLCPAVLSCMSPGTLERWLASAFAIHKNAPSFDTCGIGTSQSAWFECKEFCFPHISPAEASAADWRPARPPAIRPPCLCTIPLVELAICFGMLIQKLPVSVQDPPPCVPLHPLRIAMEVRNTPRKHGGLLQGSQGNS